MIVKAFTFEIKYYILSIWMEASSSLCSLFPEFHILIFISAHFICFWGFWLKGKYAFFLFTMKRSLHDVALYCEHNSVVILAHKLWLNYKFTSLFWKCGTYCTISRSKLWVKLKYRCDKTGKLITCHWDKMLSYFRNYKTALPDIRSWILTFVF